MQKFSLTIDEQTYITAQLGREPTGVIAVAVRDSAGLPAVITNHPLQWNGQQPAPFPTLYWLIDPSLHDAISDLERRGAVSDLEVLVAEDPVLREQVHADHQQYASRRWALLTAEEQRVANDHGFDKTLRDKGVGGIANFDAIRCLHMHAAYHLAQRAIDGSGTAVGRLMEERFGIRFPL